MKLTLSFLMIGLMAVSAESYSQSQRLNLSLQNVRITDVFSAIEQQSGYYFFFKNDEVKHIQKVDVNFQDETIEKVLSGILNNTGLNYRIVDRYIVISPKNNSDVILQPHVSVKGRVMDASGMPLPGVTVVIKGSTNGTITDVNGEFFLNDLRIGTTLQFSFVGMKTVEFPIVNGNEINVTMIEDAIGLNEIVTIGYGTQKKGLLAGSVSSVESDKLVKSPSFTSASNAIRGQVPGVVSVQSSGQPGMDQADLRIRGFGNALIIVDGIEADLNSIDPSQIETVTILKDAAASIYGSRAGNGVILITTKRGNNQKPVFSASTSFTAQGITFMPEMSSAGQIAEMRREEHLQAGKPEATAPYTEEEVQKFYDARDPQYPNTNWRDIVIRKWAPQQQHNISVRGGSEAIKYYGYWGYNGQESIWKSGNGGDYNRFNFQSNIDARILDNLSVQIDVAATWENTMDTNRSQNTGSSGGGLWQDYWATEPMWSAELPDSEKFPYGGVAGVGSILLSSDTEIIGYDKSKDNTLKGSLALDYDFPFLKGLSAKAFVNLLQTYRHSKNFSRPYDFYYYDYASDIYVLAGGYGNNNLNEGMSENQVITGQIYLKYNTSIKEKHRVSAMVISEMIDYKSNHFNAQRTGFLTSDIDYLFAGSTEGMSNDGAASEMGRMSYIGRLNYSYKDKYLLESTLRADASAKFPESKRWGYFPSVSLAWVLSEESFMKGFGSLDNLKFRTSYGKSGRDAVGNFQYLAGYQINSHTYILGQSAQTGLLTTGLANPDLTWENVVIYNAGLDFSFFKRKLYGETDLFYRIREGIPATRNNSLPSSFGASLPLENINSLNNRGFEVLIGTKGKIKNFNWDISGNLSWSRAKWDHYEEPEYTDPDQERIYKNSGKWTDRVFGYLTDGLFTNQQQIDELPFDQDQKGNTTLKPGDIRFVDVNNDLILDWKDQVEIGNGTLPQWNAGLNMDIRYENFDFSCLLQGAWGNSHRINLNRMGNPPVEFYKARWTEENNNPNAFIPRLGGSNLNNSGSDHWWLDAGYLRLKVISAGYSLSNKWLKSTGLTSCRIYIAGTNLLTYNPLKKYGVDPEAPSNGDGFYYPQQRTVTLGLNMSF